MLFGLRARGREAAPQGAASALVTRQNGKLCSLELIIVSLVYWFIVPFLRIFTLESPERCSAAGSGGLYSEHAIRAICKAHSTAPPPY